MKLFLRGINVCTSWKKRENLYDIYKQCVVVAAIQVSLRVILGWILTSGAGGKKIDFSQK